MNTIVKVRPHPQGGYTLARPVVGTARMYEGWWPNRAGAAAARRRMRQELELMLAELESSRLEVVLVPARFEVNVGACVRVAISRNADWYRRFCGAHGSSRRRRNLAWDTCVKRRDTVRLLETLIGGRATRSGYAEELLSIAWRRCRKEVAA